MIICPNCKEEIDDNSHFCDQCGQALLFCKNCGRVGIGRRCTYCGGLMVTPDEIQQAANENTAFTSGVSQGFVSQGFGSHASQRAGMPGGNSGSQGLPMLVLYNSNLNVRIVGINGAVIGRRQGPYVQFFAQNRYVSGVHAQLKYNVGTGWCIVDKHSSNGTKLNQHPLQPDVEMSIKNGDILTIANINLEVSIN
jgi:hypothetical protein